MGAAFIVNARTHGDSCDLTLIFFAFLHEEKRGGGSFFSESVRYQLALSVVLRLPVSPPLPLLFYPRQKSSYQVSSLTLFVLSYSHTSKLHLPRFFLPFSATHVTKRREVQDF